MRDLSSIHRGQTPIGLMIKCIGSRVTKLLDMENASNLLGKVLIFRNMGNIVNFSCTNFTATLAYFTKHLLDSLEKEGRERGSIVIEGHTDCGAIKLAHLYLDGLESPYKEALTSIIDLIKEEFRKIRFRGLIFEKEIEIMVNEAIEYSRILISEKFYP